MTKSLGQIHYEAAKKWADINPDKRIGRLPEWGNLHANQQEMLDAGAQAVVAPLVEALEAIMKRGSVLNCIEDDERIKAFAALATVKPQEPTS